MVKREGGEGGCKVKMIKMGKGEREVLKRGKEYHRQRGKSKMEEMKSINNEEKIKTGERKRKRTVGLGGVCRMMMERKARYSQVPCKTK